MKIVETGIIETISFAEDALLKKNPELALKYLSMVPDVYRNRSGYSNNIGIIERNLKEKLKQ